MSELEERLLLTAHDALAHWALKSPQIELASRSENVVFKVTDADSKHYALRIHRPGYNSRLELEAELSWTEALNAAGVHTPAHVLTKDGSGYAEVVLHGTQEPHMVGLIEWLPGELLSARIREATEAQVNRYLFQLGQLIGRLHEQAADWQPPREFRRRTWDADGLVGTEPLWGQFWQARALADDEAELLASVREKLHAQLIDLGKASNTYSLIHADLHAHNVIIHGNVLQAIDFDDCGFGWHYYDLAVAFNEFAQRKNAQELQQHLLDGYESIRTLPDTRTLVPMFLLIRGLVSIGWINARPELVSPDALRPHVEPALKLARDYLSRN